VQIAIEKVDAARTKQEAMDTLQLQEERVQREKEQVAKEAELDKKKAKYIRQVNTKEINEAQFWELVGGPGESNVGEHCGGACNDTGNDTG
jgi:hypothetical protein